MKKQTLIDSLLLVLLLGGIVFVMTFHGQNEENNEGEENKDYYPSNVVDIVSEEETIHSEPVTDNFNKNNVVIGDIENTDEDVIVNQPIKNAPNNTTVIYFFWGDGCPHCANQKPFLEEMEKKYSELEVKMFEVYRSKNNQKLFQEIAQAYGIQARGVPATFIGDFEPIIGFGTKETTGVEIEDRIKQCIEDGCISPEKKL
jgi:thiol-disulfide isomerase/thioredoxin